MTPQQTFLIAFASAIFGYVGMTLLLRMLLK